MTDIIEMTVAEIHQLATDVLSVNGCDCLLYTSDAADE